MIAIVVIDVVGGLVGDVRARVAGVTDPVAVEILLAVVRDGVAVVVPRFMVIVVDIEGIVVEPLADDRAAPQGRQPRALHLGSAGVLTAPRDRGEEGNQESAVDHGGSRVALAGVGGRRREIEEREPVIVQVVDDVIEV